jgi:hypothetical protein
MPPVPQKKTYRFMGDHATELSVGNNLPWVGPGDFIDLDSGDAGMGKAKVMVDEGLLVDISTIKPDPEVNPLKENEEGGK